MKLIQCNPSYWEFVRNLRNDPNNLHGFINNKYITTEDQITYMTKYNDNYYICLDNNNLPLGFIGNIKNLVINFLPPSGNELYTEVITKTQVMNVSIIEANSYSNNELVATCEMKIFLQENA